MSTPNTTSKAAESAGAEDPGPRRVEIDIAPAAIAKILGTVAALVLLAGIWQILIWIVISLMFVATFNPLVRRMQSRIQRPWAITALVTLCVGAFGLLLALVIPPLLRQGESTAAHLPEYLAQVEATAARMHLHVNVHAAVAHWSSRAGAHVLDYSLLLANSLLGIFTVFVLTIYLLIEGPQVATSLTSLLPRGDRLHVRRMFGEIGVQVGAYMRGQLITSSVAGLFAFIILFALHVPEPLALAFLMMLADLIPIVGPLIGTVPALLMALTQGVPVAVEVLVGYIIYLQVEANFISPRVYGSALKLSPFVVLVALLIGGALMGMLGAMLALPVAAAIPIVARYVAEWRERSEADAAPTTLP